MKLNQYVAETKLQLNQRINLPRSDVNTRKLERSPIAEHIHTTGHILSDISLCCIDHNPNWSEQTRKLREVYWIRKLNTTQLQGINKSDEFRISRQNNAQYTINNIYATLYIISSIFACQSIFLYSYLPIFRDSNILIKSCMVYAKTKR